MLTVKLSAEDPYRVFKPHINYFINKIIKKEHFLFAKINHAFWQMLDDDDPWRTMYETLHDDDLIKEVLSIIKNINKTNIMLAVSHIGPPQLPNAFVAVPIIEQIKKALPSNYIPYYGVVWKEAELNGSIVPFYEALKKMRTIIVGLNHLSKNKHNFEHFELDLNSSKPENRNKVLNELEKTISSKNEDCVVLLQAGDLFSTWIIYHLRNRVKNCSIIDMGRALDALVSTEHLVFSKKDQELGSSIFKDFNKQDWIRYK